MDVAAYGRQPVELSAGGPDEKSEGFEGGDLAQLLEDFRVPLLEEFFDLRIVEQLADVALGGAEMECVLAELVLEDAEIAFETFHFPLHAGDLFGREAFDLLRFVGFDHLVGVRADEKRAGVGEGVVVSADHELRHLDLVERLHLFHDAQGAFADRLLLENLHRFGMQAVEEVFALDDFFDVEVEPS